MEYNNHSSVEEDFLIVGFSDLHQLQIPIFIVLLLIYVLILMGNLLIIITIYSNSQLHTPMYFFLTNLSFIDICCTSIIFPQLLAHFFHGGRHVSFTECLLQISFFIVIVAAEVLLLAIMAYDRYVAICDPLHYMTIMNRNFWNLLTAGSWIFGFIDSLPPITMLSQLSFCQTHMINHFFCDATVLVKISCTSTHEFEILSYTMGSILTLPSFILIIASYGKIASCIFKNKSKRGRHKAFSTCSSHLTVVLLFYGSLCLTYMRPTSTFSMKESKIMSLCYIAVTPLCNPIIYTLKNTEFKSILSKRKDII